MSINSIYILNLKWNIPIMARQKYNIKQVEVITINEDNDIIIITAIAKYF